MLQGYYMFLFPIDFVSVIGCVNLRCSFLPSKGHHAVVANNKLDRLQAF